MCAQAVVPAPVENGTSGTVTAWFKQQIAGRPDDPALYFRAGNRWASITWKSFAEASRRISAYLLSENVEIKDHVAIWSNNRPEWHIADIAILSIRAVPTPVYFSLSAEQGQYVLNHSDSVVAFVEHEGVLEKVLSQRSSLPQLRRVVVMDPGYEGSGNDFVLTWQQALARGQENADKFSVEIDTRARSAEPDEVATLIYTSGTTGPPKAVQITHRNLDAANRTLEKVFSPQPGDRALSYLPLAHIVERVVSEFRSYRYGTSTYFLDSLPNLAERLQEVRPTIFFGVPRVWEKMQTKIERGVAETHGVKGVIARWALRVAARHEEYVYGNRQIPWLLKQQHGLAENLVLKKIRIQAGLDQARYLISGAAPIRLETLKFFQSIGLTICEGYGQSENTAITSINPPNGQRLGTVGKPLPDVEVMIADDGEILMRGPVVFPGYYKNEQATREMVDPDGWLHTGDIGVLESDGYLRITDRKKDLIITAGGKNISPSNIEGMLASHPLIGQAVCIGDQRPFVSALLVLDPEEAPIWAEAHGISVEHSLQAMAANAAIESAVALHVKNINAHLSQVEQVKQWQLLPNDFKIGEELTPTLKVKRKFVAERYASQIEEMYSRRKQPAGDA